MRLTTTMKFTTALAGLALIAACSGTITQSGEWLSFSEISPGSTSNRALICSPEICPAASEYEPAASFDVVAEDLAVALRELEPDAEFQTLDNGDIRARYVDVTMIMRFRDDVDILIRPQGEDASLFAAYSRSRVGKSDLGKNASRLNTLVSDLREAVE